MFNLIKLPCSEEERLEERAVIFFSVSFDQLETAFKMIPAYKGFQKKKRKKIFPLCVRSENSVLRTVVLDGTRCLGFKRSITGNRPTETKDE
jgi:hypothetical protein